MAYHKDDPAFTKLIENGEITSAFRRALNASAWRPATNTANNPPVTHCDTSDWVAKRYGAGTLDVSTFLAAPLAADTRPSGGTERLPLFSSLYPTGTESKQIESDFLGMFGKANDGFGRGVSP